MAEEIKRIPVADQEQAVTVINRLSQEYAMQVDTQRHQLHVSNEHFAAYGIMGQSQMQRKSPSERCAALACTVS